MLVDSHCHVSTPRYDADRAEVLARARAAGVQAMVDVGCDLASSEASAALAAREPDVWAVVGLHPHEARHWDEATPDRLRALAALPRVLAVGEMGLDFYYDHSPRDVQRQVFRAQLALARELDLPAVLHVRDAYDEALDILDEAAAGPGAPLRGVAHCFTGEARQALGFVERGFGVSFTGVVTFKSADPIREAASAVPLDRLLVETDCPYMAPVPLRGKRCEPAHVEHTARAIAVLRGLPEEELFAATARNAARIFGFPLA
ncbi:MAG: TatD family hydrolase [Planctomycetota bacterium]